MNFKTIDELHTAGRYLIHLLRCALRDEIPAEKPADITWEQLFTLAKYNNVENTVAPAIKNYGFELSETIREEWEKSISSTVYRLARFDFEREQILAGMAGKGLAYLPLKGILLAEYYQKPGMRWMCDNDILYGYAGNTDGYDNGYDEAAGRALYEVMTELGYDAENLGGCHDVYQKKPFFNFEMHQSFVPKESSVWEYYRNPWKRALPVDGEPYHYRLSDEDEYIFMIVHANKHFDNSGCGVRTLTDEYAFLTAKPDMNRDYINRELEKLSLVDFEADLRDTAVRAFAGEQMTLSDDSWDMIYYMLGSGTYGTMTNRVHRSILKIQKAESTDMSGARKKYMTGRIWVSESKMKQYYPFFYRHKAFRVFLPVYRLIKGLFVHPRQLWYEWKNVRKCK